MGGESWLKKLDSQEDYSCVRKARYHHEGESWPKKLHSQEDYSCVRKARYHHEGESWPKKLQIQEDYSCVKKAPSHHEGESWPKKLYGLENYSYVKSERLTKRMKVGPRYCKKKKTTVVSWRVLSPYKDESGLMKLYGQENYGCVRKTPSHQKGESWPKGPVSSGGHCLTKGVIVGQKVLYVPEDY